VSLRISSALVPLLAVAFAGPVLAQETAPLKVAIVDVEQVLTQTEAGRERLSALDSFAGRERTRLERLQQELEDLRARIQAAQEAGTGEVEDLRRELQRKTIVFNQAAEDTAREVQQRRQTVFEEMEGLVMPVIQAIGEEGGYTLIFRNLESGLVYVDPATDITGEVIARVDANTPPPAPDDDAAP